MIHRLPTRTRAVLVAAASALTVAVIGGTLTTIGPWYRGLAKPGWTPPDLAFPIVWTVIFALAAASGATGWRHAASRVTREWLIEVGGLWLSIAILIVFLARVSGVASALLAPYLAWVSVAAALNYEVVRLNAPFGAG